MRLGLSSYTYTWAVGVPGSLPPKQLSASDLVDKAAASGLNLVQIADNLPLETMKKSEFIDLRKYGEALGMALPGSASAPAVDNRRDADAFAAGEAVVNLIRLGITARDIMTKKAFENAITTVIALGGSTNAVIHLLAMAHAVDVPLTLNDFQLKFLDEIGLLNS